MRSSYFASVSGYHGGLVVDILTYYLSALSLSFTAAENVRCLYQLRFVVCCRACNSWSWVPVVAPHVGGVIGAWIYLLCVGAHLRHHVQPAIIS